MSDFAPGSVNELERIRVRLGVSRPELLSAIGGRPGREGPFACANEHIDPIFLRRAYQLETLYNRWKAKVLREVEPYQQLSVQQLTEILGTYPIKLLRLRTLGFLGVPEVKTQWSAAAPVLDPSDVERLFHLNETYLQTKSVGRASNRRAPLSGLFLQWVKREHVDYWREVAPTQRAPTATIASANVEATSV